MDHATNWNRKQKAEMGGVIFWALNSLLFERKKVQLALLAKSTGSDYTPLLLDIKESTHSQPNGLKWELNNIYATCDDNWMNFFICFFLFIWSLRPLFDLWSEKHFHQCEKGSANLFIIYIIYLSRDFRTFVFEVWPQWFMDLWIKNTHNEKKFLFS
jgi:hypothetical protein